jgi:hypothetical protein
MKRLFLLALLAVSLPAFSQNRVLLSSSGRGVGSAPSAMCVREGEAFIRIASQYPAVHNWTFYIVCTERSWRQFVRKSGQLDHGVLLNGVAYHNQPDVQVYGTTYLGSRVTYIRGYKLLYPDPGITPDRIVAHELAHIVLNSTDEVRDDHLALQWIAEHQQTGRPVSFNNNIASAAPDGGQRGQ